MKVYCNCKYCDYKWDLHIYNAYTLKSLKCPKCNDPNIKTKDEARIEKIDYYQGSPPFKAEEDDSFLYPDNSD